MISLWFFLTNYEFVLFASLLSLSQEPLYEINLVAPGLLNLSFPWIATVDSLFRTIL